MLNVTKFVPIFMYLYVIIMLPDFVCRPTSQPLKGIPVRRFAIPLRDIRSLSEVNGGLISSDVHIYHIPFSGLLPYIREVGNLLKK